MKFLTYAALTLGVSALRLDQMSSEMANLLPEDMNIQLATELTDKDPMDDFKAAVEKELKKDGTLELGELYGIIKKIAKKYDYKLPKGWKKHVKKMFDYVDANNDGHVTGEEIEAAMKKHEGDSSDDDIELDDPMDDIEAAVEAEIEKDGSLELDELYGIVKKVAKKYKFKLPKGWKKHIKKIFDYVDANDDGKVTGPEIEAAMKKHEGDSSDDEEIQLTENDPMDDFKAAVEAELEKDGSLKLDELYAIIKKIAKKYNYKLPKGWKKHVKKMFNYVDANNDGKVTGEEIEAAMKKHEQDDLELDEPVTATMLQLGLEGPKEDLIAAFKHVYTTGDKQMSFKEFDDIVDSICAKYHHPAPSDADLKKAFDMMDADGNGQVTLKELIDFAKKMSKK